MSTPPADNVSPQKKTGRKKSKKASVDGASSPTDANHVNEVTAPLKLTPEQLEPSQDPVSESKRENESMKELSRREKKLKKKLTLIEASEEKIKDLPEQEKATTTKINPDERRKISEKPIHQAVYKEVKEIMDILVKCDAIDEKRVASEKAQLIAAHSEELEKAKEEGRKEATIQADENLRLLLSFLRNVSLRRSWAANGQVLDPLEEKAFEAALVAVYDGNDNALAACHKLFSGLDEPVKEGTATWNQLKEICTEKKPEPAEEEAQAEATAVASDDAEKTADGAEPPAEATREESPIDATLEEYIVVEEEAVAGSENITIPTEEAETAPPAVTTTDDTAANAAAEYPTELVSEPVSSPAEGTDLPVLTEVALNAQAEPTEEETKATEEAPKTNGDFRPAHNGRGRGGPRGGYRGRGDYRGDGYRPRGDYRGGQRGEHRGEGRGSYGGGRGDRGGYRGRGEGYSGGRGGGHRGRGGFHQNQQQQQPQAQGA